MQKKLVTKTFRITKSTSAILLKMKKNYEKKGLRSGYQFLLKDSVLSLYNKMLAVEKMSLKKKAIAVINK